MLSCSTPLHPGVDFSVLHYSINYIDEELHRYPSCIVNSQQAAQSVLHIFSKECKVHCIFITLCNVHCFSLSLCYFGFPKSMYFRASAGSLLPVTEGNRVT